MSEKDISGQHLIHIRVNAYEKQVLEMMRAKHGASFSGAVRACIRAAGIQAGLTPKNHDE